MKFSFVIPTIRQTTMVKRCIETLKKFHPDEDIEIVVVDDGSQQQVRDYLTEMCREEKVELLLNSTNSGFSATVNRGIDRSRNEIIVLVNNDIIFTENITEELKKTFDEDEKIGVVGGLLLYPHGTIQHGGVVHLGGDRFLHRAWHKEVKDSEAARSKDYIIGVTGALFAIRRKMCDEIGVFGTRYFVAFEDTEYCLRAWNCGWKVFYNGSVQAIHEEGATRGNTPQQKRFKGKEWIVKEEQSRLVFREDLRKYSIPQIQAMVAFENKRNLEPVIRTSVDTGVIGINRAGALGDVLLATGLLKKIKEKYPGYDIHFSTLVPNVLRNNPYISKIVTRKSELQASVVYDLDMIYESNPNQHVIKSYANVILGDVDIKDLRPEMHSTVQDKERLLRKIPKQFFWKKKIAVVHMTMSWQNRTWPRNYWMEVIQALSELGIKVVIVGSGNDFRGNASANVMNMNGKLDLMEIRELIKLSNVFIGMDSGLLHVACTTETAAVGLFTCANPDYRLIHRNARTIGLIPKLDCRFCLHEQKPPVTFVGCKYKTFKCVHEITPIQVLGAVMPIIGG